MSLPILSLSFFEKHRPTAALFQQWQTLAPWSESAMPIYEWDNVLYVACSQEPKLSIQTDKKVVFVSCEASILKSLWNEFNESPEGISATAHIPSAAPQSASFDDLDMGSEKTSIAPASEEMPEGLSLDLETPSAPSGLELADSEATETAANEPLVIEEPLAIEEPLEEAPPIVAKAKPILPKTEEASETVAGYTKITSSSSSQDEVFDGIMAEMEKNFPKCMLLVAQGEKNHEELKPYKWNASFGKANPQGKSTAIPLNLPSPFRVIFRTQKSYHGYIVPNDQNDKFFAEWNESQNPDHMTLSPILVDDVLVGAVLGLSDKSADTKTTLLQTEHLCEAVAKKFRSQPSLIKAA